MVRNKSIWFSLFFLLITILCCCRSLEVQRNLREVTPPVEKGRMPTLVVNQVGYFLSGPKVAMFLNAPIEKRKGFVKLVERGTNKEVYTIKLGRPIKDKQSLDVIQVIDFTSFTRKGIYFLKIGGSNSYPFKIGEDIYMEPFVKMLRSYYLQRCGVAIMDPVTGIKHPPCHTKDARIAHDDPFHRAGEYLPTRGGWHDAGDYGKYIATTAVTVGELLHLFEQCPELFYDGQMEFPDNARDPGGMPQSGNGVPDILDEMRVGLEWMLSMQREDGAVYRKLSGKEWPPLVPPDRDNQNRFIYGISTPETAKFVAAMAMASRIYKPYDPEFSRRCLRTAMLSWQYLERNPEMYVEWYEGDDSGSGKYLYSRIDTEKSLLTDVDDRFWAAAELFITTGDEKAKSYIDEHIHAIPFTLFEWKDASSLGLIDLYLAAGGRGYLAGVIRKKLLARADQVLKRVRESGYRLANHRFIWGSNKMTAQEGITLYYAYRMTGIRDYFSAAVDQLDYLFGRNHFNKSFVTGVGANPVKHVSHLFARANQLNIPGLLVGGPNEMAQAGIAPKHMGPLSYVDDARSYATNEYAIDYNASLITLMGLLMEGRR